MTERTNGHVPFHDRLLARWEAGLLGLALFGNAVFVVSGVGTLLVLAEITGIRPVLAARTLVGLWLVFAVAEIGRFMWAADHRYASPRWMRARRRAG